MAYNDLPPLGQATKAASLPVTFASDQEALPLSTGASSSAKQDTIIGHLDGVETLLTAIDGRVDGLEALQTTANGLLTDIETAVDGLEASVASIDTKTPALGQAAKAGSTPVVIASDQDALNVQEQALMVTGAAAQTATVNNILTDPSGSVATDLQNYRTATVQVVSTGTAGTFIFEQSNDNVNFVALPVFNAALVTGVPITTAITATNSSIIYSFPVRARYVRLRIATTITGGSIRAHSRFSTEPWTAAAQLVASNTAANMLVTATASGNYAVTMAANATTTPAKARDGVAGASDTGIPAQFVRRDTPTAVTPIAGDYEFAQISANGEQWVRLAGELADDAAFTVGTTRVVPTGFLADETTTDSVDEGDAGIARMTLNRRQIMAGNVLDDSVFGIGTEYTNPASFLADETTTDSVDEGDVGVGRMTLDRKQIITAYAHTAGGWTPHKAVSAASTNATSLKASAGQVGGFQVFNLNASPRYLKFYNKASSPTVGTDTSVKVIMIPGNATGAGAIMGSLSGVEFTTGIAYALTTGITDADTGAVAVNEIVVNIDWK